MLNHPDMMWRYAETMTRQAELEGRACFRPPVLSALSTPGALRLAERIRGLRGR